MWRHASWSTGKKAIVTGLIAVALTYSPETNNQGSAIPNETTAQISEEVEENIEVDSEDSSIRKRLKAEEAKLDSIAKVEEEYERLKCIGDADAFHRELQEMHEELQSFRKTEDFSYYGFAPGGEYFPWLEKIGKMKDDPRDRCCLMYKKCVAGDLEMLGMEYASNNGRDTEYSIRTSKLFRGDNSQAENITTILTSGKWYEGGTLHKATIARWKTSTERNKLATCGDFIATYDKSISSMTILKARAVSLMTCIDVATSGLDYTNDFEVATMAALCIQEMDY